MSTPFDKRRDPALAVLLTVAHLAFVLATQPGITAGFGLGWDGVYYYLMAAGTAPPGHHYGERVAVPFLARHFFFSDLRLNFLIINLLFAVAFSVLSYLAVASVTPHQSVLTKVTSWCLLCATHLSPIPQTVWYPTQTDTAANATLIALFYALLAGATSPLVYLLLFMGGTLVRENFPVFAVFLVIVVHLEPPSRPYRAWLVRSLRTNRLPLIMLAGAIAGSVLAFAVLVQAAPYNPFALKGQLFLKWVGRHSLVSVLTGLVSVYGAAGFFYLLYRVQPTGDAPVQNPFRDRRWGFVAALLTLLVMSFGGGTNRERYFFWGLPFAVVYLAPYIEALIQRRRYATWAFGFVFMLLFQRSLLPIEPSGIGGCDAWSYVTGGSTWIGHWTQMCTATDALRLSATYLGVCATVIVLAKVSSRLTATTR